ncbi:MAG: hypothetical protein WBP22_03120 [Candidatus Saccharimonas sp.]
MNDDQFTKLFNYITDMDKRIDARFDMLESEVISLRSIPDEVAANFVNIETEQAARDAQWSRLLEWAREVSKKTGVPLPDL